ncbi:hypothetical protein [Solicola gregarius]|uniref:Terminase small subunit n=1 Tax=Solicola gregarius TaxID=2908642 RepID=A0AA46YJX4_9ACTN|nr:hypothetical protein [Solicola gregarius]UYM03448.1 hypothetical protein L0C25_12865 [Solicola gregarius]
MTKPRTPARLQARGRALWSSVVDAYDLRPDELVLLAHAARTADTIEQLEDALRTAPLTVSGSQGQERINSMLPEVRQQRVVLASMLRQLRLPDDPTEVRTVAEAQRRSMSARKAARARWDLGKPS